MEKAVVGLIASLGIIGAIATKTSNKVKDAETFMANMRGTRQVVGGQYVGTGKGVRKIPRNKLNFSAFEKDLPAIITKSNLQNWQNLANLNWTNITEIARKGSQDHYPQQTYTQLNNLYAGGKLHARNPFEYSSLAGKIEHLSAQYSMTQDRILLTPSFKKAMTAFKKLNANLEKGIKDYKQQQYLRDADMPKVAKYVAFKKFMENAADGAEKLAKSYGGEFDRKAFNDFMKSCSVGGYLSGQQGYTYQDRSMRTTVLNTIRNLSYYSKAHSSHASLMQTYKGLVSNLMGYYKKKPNVDTLDPDVAFQDPARVAVVLNALTPYDLARLYQYGMFFNDNPIIQFVGTNSRPYGKQEEMYFSKYASRKDMTLWRVLPKELRIDKKRYVAILRNRSRGLMSQVSKIENEANTLARIKEDAANKNKENATKAVIQQVQTALDGGLVAGRMGRSFNRMHHDKAELTQEQKVQLALSLIENPTSTMTTLLIYPSTDIMQYWGELDEKGMPFLNHAKKVNLMQHTNLLSQVKAEEVLKGITLDPAMKGQIENHLSARYQEAIASNDRSIANLAQQMTRYIENKDAARKSYDKALNLVDFAF